QSTSVSSGASVFDPSPVEENPNAVMRRAYASNSLDFESERRSSAPSTPSVRPPEPTPEVKAKSAAVAASTTTLRSGSDSYGKESSLQDRVAERSGEREREEKNLGTE